MKINGREVRQAPRTIDRGEIVVEIWKEGNHIPWPVAEDTINDLCDTLREIVEPMKGLYIYNVTVIRQGNSGSAKFDFIHRDERHSSNNGVTREIRDFCNKTLGESKAEPGYKAVLEKIKIIIDDMPQLERWLGAAEAAKGFKLICDLLNETL